MAKKTRPRKPAAEEDHSFKFQTLAELNLPTEQVVGLAQELIRVIKLGARLTPGHPYSNEEEALFVTALEHYLLYQQDQVPGLFHPLPGDY